MKFVLAQRQQELLANSTIEPTCVFRRKPDTDSDTSRTARRAGMTLLLIPPIMRWPSITGLPARGRKPRDKAKAEAGVLMVERWMHAQGARIAIGNARYRTMEL
jgi:hypothetical protein